MTISATYLDHAVELFSSTGPTGEFARVLRGEVQDAGGNVLFAGSADDCHAFSLTVRVPSRLVATSVGTPLRNVCGADVTWGTLS